MTNKDLTAEVLKSNMDSEAKAEVIDLIYRFRKEETEEKPKIRKKRAVKEPATGPGGEGRE